MNIFDVIVSNKYNKQFSIYFSNNFSYKRKHVSTWFGTGGAGFCISRHLAGKMKQFILKNEFIRLSARVGHADDVMIGLFIITF